jgi:ribosomal protein S18 acetylase RimI-like enzyme
MAKQQGDAEDSTRIELFDASGESKRQSIMSILLDYNRSKNLAFFEARELPANKPQPLNVVALGPEERVLGGLIADTQFSWLMIDMLSVVEDMRRSGIGRRLMAAAEAEAIARGCSNSFVDTMDYQAPGFYEKLGYCVAGKLEDWDSHGHCKYFFTKKLNGHAT